MAFVASNRKNKNGRRENYGNRMAKHKELNGKL